MVYFYRMGFNKRFTTLQRKNTAVLKTGNTKSMWTSHILSDQMKDVQNKCVYSGIHSL